MQYLKINIKRSSVKKIRLIYLEIVYLFIELTMDQNNAIIVYITHCFFCVNKFFANKSVSFIQSQQRL